MRKFILTAVLTLIAVVLTVAPVLADTIGPGL